jgi:hypothetical protein
MNADPDGTIIDMTPDGRFRDPVRTPWSARATGLAALAAVVAAAMLGLVLAVWLAVTVLPIVVGLVLAAFLLSMIRNWRRRSVVAR